MCAEEDSDTGIRQFNVPFLEVEGETCARVRVNVVYVTLNIMFLEVLADLAVPRWHSPTLGCGEEVISNLVVALTERNLSIWKLAEEVALNHGCMLVYIPRRLEPTSSQPQR